MCCLSDDGYQISMAYRFHWVYYKRDVRVILKAGIHRFVVIISFVTINFIKKNFIYQLKNVCRGCGIL